MPTMQFPYPRKTSHPPPYQNPRASTFQRRRALRNIAPYGLGIFAIILVFLYFLRSSSPAAPRPPPGTPPVVIVTTLDAKQSEHYKANIIENRKDYASRHGYATFFPNTTDYDLMSGVPSSWSTVPSMRHAMTLYPHTPWIFYLTSTALIMNPSQPLDAKILEPRKLESLMIVDRPVVPPDSVIKTFSHLKGERVDFMLTQDKEGLAGGSMLLRNGEWAKFFLDAWYDPLHRSYNFQKAEGHALEHIVQWHGTVLSKLALVPQRVLNGYTKEVAGSEEEGRYQEGDFIANFHGCARDPKRDCEMEMKPLMVRWKELRDGEGRR
ncbi:putative alpha-1,6-mannosyltransferase mnn11 [Oleoguttula sp. CCFEE 5521]